MSRFYSYIKNQWLLGGFNAEEMAQLVVMKRITEEEKIKIMEGK